MIKILCDSITDLPIEIIEKHNVDIVPLTVIFNEKEYLDRVDITNKEFYKMLRESETMPKTSQATYAQFVEFFEKYKDDEILYLAGSSAASGTYQSAILAKGDVDANITIFDTLNLSLGSGLLVIKACEMVEQGLSVDEIVKNLENLRNDALVTFSVDTLEYLKKGGRIGRVAGTVGELLNLKPIITTDENGVYYNVAKVRGRKQSLSKLTEILKGYLEKGICEVAVLHAGCEDEAIKFRDSFKNLPNITSIKIAEISPALGVHGGPGLIGFSVKLVK